VILGSFFPWTPLGVVLLEERSIFRNERVRFLLAWLLWGLAFFSLSLNKLPGYVLPLCPALAALVGIALAAKRNPRQWLFALCGAWVWLFPIAGGKLPAILLHGLSQVNLDISPWWILPALASAILAGWLEAHGRRGMAAGLIAGLVAVFSVGIVFETYPVLDRTVSAREFWRTHPLAQCSEEINRGWRYSLDYYANRNLPLCK